MARGEERRTKRSDRPALAVRYLLEYNCRRYRLSAQALADQDGLLITGAGDEQACDTVAAYAPLVSDRVVDRQRVSASVERVLTGARACAVEYRAVAGRRDALHVCGVGEPGSLDEALRHISQGVERIMLELG